MLQPPHHVVVIIGVHVTLLLFVHPLRRLLVLVIVVLLLSLAASPPPRPPALSAAALPSAAVLIGSIPIWLSRPPPSPAGQSGRTCPRLEQDTAPSHTFRMFAHAGQPMRRIMAVACRAIGRSVKCACSIMSSRHKAVHGYEASKAMHEVCLTACPHLHPLRSSMRGPWTRMPWRMPCAASTIPVSGMQDMAKFPELRRLHAQTTICKQQETAAMLPCIPAIHRAEEHSCKPAHRWSALAEELCREVVGVQRHHAAQRRARARTLPVAWASRMGRPPPHLLTAVALWMESGTVSNACHGTPVWVCKLSVAQSSTDSRHP